MFSPLDDPNITHWFERLDTAWKRMPAEEQTRQREEVQQHLEALVAAHEELGSSPEEAWSLALVQFGNPTKIGRKLHQEWRQGRVGFRAEMAAIFFGLEIQALMWFVGIGLPMLGFPILADVLFCLGTTQLILYVMIGRRYPRQAIKAALYLDILHSTWLLGTYHTNISSASVLSFFFVVGLHVMFAYFASVTRRGWYKPTLNDFKLTLPKRRQVSR